MQLSLFVKLKELEKIGHISLQQGVAASPPLTLKPFFAEDGRWVFKGKPLEILADFEGLSPDGGGFRFNEPHDIAWCPEEKVVLAYAKVSNEPFRLIPKRLKPKFKNRGA